jgi:septal ring factor EnvC (AmiA/AmiB activator)
VNLIFNSDCRFRSHLSHTTSTMDALKAEIASKRKALQDDPVTSPRQTKYMRRGDIEKLKEERELKEREEKEHKEKEREEAEAIKKAARMKVCISSLFVCVCSRLS